MANEMLEKIKAYMESEEGKKKTEEYFGKIANRKKVNERWFIKFDNLSQESKNSFIQKCEEKYSSEAYINRWYKRGLEPHTELLFYLYDYASSRDLPQIEMDDYDSFTSGKFLLTYKWGVRRLDGQGSVCQVFRVDKYKLKL